MPTNKQFVDFQDLVCNGDIDRVRSLIALDPALVTLENGDNSGLILAADSGNEEMVKLLLEGGANVNYANETGDTPLAAACFSGSIELVKLLLEKGANIEHVDRFGVSILDNARDHPELVFFLKNFQNQKRLALKSKGWLRFFSTKS